jgi:hypothetical protein
MALTGEGPTESATPTSPNKSRVGIWGASVSSLQSLMAYKAFFAFLVIVVVAATVWLFHLGKSELVPQLWLTATALLGLHVHERAVPAGSA